MTTPSTLIRRFCSLLVMGMVFGTIYYSNPHTAQANQSGPNTGAVNIPLEVYKQLLKNAEPGDTKAPAGYALGKADIQVSTSETDLGINAEIHVQMQVKVYESRWILAPILPSGTAITSATINGNAVQLLPTPMGLSWSTNKAGIHKLHVSYRVDANRSPHGSSLPIPVPRAASTTLSASLPGTNLDVAVIPSAGLATSHSGNTTQLRATLPTTNGVQISWRVAAQQGYTFSRASYRGTLAQDAISLRGDFVVELLGKGTVTLPLLPATTILKDVTVDGKPASIFVDGDNFATILQGRGTHKIVVQLQVPVLRANGPPQASIAIPRVPVSRFELALPGKKEIQVKPASQVTYRKQGTSTIATVFVPMTDTISFHWTEAIPEAVKADVRANASIYHDAHAEEGVLHARAVVVYEVTRGETKIIKLLAPPDAQINRIVSDNGGVADWRISPTGKGKPHAVTVFLNRAIKGQFGFTIHYEKLLGVGAEASSQITLPLVRANDVHRQRGMIALLTTKEFTLKPVEEKLVTRVGENQLPALVRDSLDKTVTHTYKYVENAPTLVVQASPPEKKQGKFDAQVDTLLSLTDVTLKGSARVEINVKSGSIADLQLELPKGVNFLSLSAPSLRTHKIHTEGDLQVIDVQFTQDMEGQLRLETVYERILADSAAEVHVPTLKIRGAEVEQGRIAVEALAAVEVQPGTVEQLSSLDVAELPQQLILKTTNPILLAYKYVHVDPPYQLSLQVTRHREIDVQAATIDNAHYRTLYTRDGLAVTRAQFHVRNSRLQFLKVTLPPDSTVWSAFVNGKAEKPALMGNEKDAKNSSAHVLIKIINSTEGFPVDLIYATKVPKVGSLGTLQGQLPHPHMIVTNSKWDIYVPDDLHYRTPKTNMTLVAQHVPVTKTSIHSEVSANTDSDSRFTAPLRISVPTSGLRYTFEKLYANQSGQANDHAWFSLPYASRGGTTLASLLSIFGALLFWCGAILLITRKHKHQTIAVVGTVLGVGLILVTTGYLGQSLRPAFWTSVLVLLGLAGKWLYTLAVAQKREKTPSVSRSIPTPQAPLPTPVSKETEEETDKEL